MDTLRLSLVAVAILATVVATAALSVSASPSNALVVTDADSGEEILEVPVEDGTEVTLSYTHSVEKTPVRDVYVVDDPVLRADRMVFHSHGAGLPSSSDIERTGEGFVVRSNESYEALSVVPGSIAGHELVIDGERHDLVEKSDGPVSITLSDRSLGDRIVGDTLGSSSGPCESNSLGPNALGPNTELAVETHGREIRDSIGAVVIEPSTT
ncbi:DUF1850 domain-containing protein [Halostagnicola sp. A-GB9-2]|uniref:DUF1850 domain-containing protein n=1 Tax=Halostagnicola sp. A-GB9-2 TaxID=3048066 RepID=UPI0024C0283A|nr:DUF1850 domain-containing protein [Halostagnicola sp. A-GB9-2]MDJ1430891.1 DUF1850 domain-containing protein [Halostagnicola sp. A-GB9-2]